MGHTSHIVGWWSYSPTISSRLLPKMEYSRLDMERKIFHFKFPKHKIIEKWKNGKTEASPPSPSNTQQQSAVSSKKRSINQHPIQPQPNDDDISKRR